MSAQQPLEEALCSGAVPPVLHQDVEHGAVLVDRAPKAVQDAVDAQEHLIPSAESEALDFP
jgi:hypothetical protein